MEIGPLQLFMVALEEPEFRGEIAREIDRLRLRGDIRIIDLLAVHKDRHHELHALTTTDLTGDRAVEVGAVIGGLLGLGAAGEGGIDAGAVAGALVVADEYEYGLEEDSLEDIADSIPTGGGALVALIEHRWALPLKRAVRDAGGVIVAQDMLSPELLIGVGEELMNAVAAANESPPSLLPGERDTTTG